MDSICWYRDGSGVADYHKVCIKAYGSNEAGGWNEDVKQHLEYDKGRSNGKMCRSMFATSAAFEYDADCSDVPVSDGQCSPFYGSSPNFKVESCGITECQCGLSGTNSGFCGLAPSRLHE